VTEARFAASIRRITKALKAAPVPNGRGALMVTTSSGAIIVRHNEIDWIESADNYSRIWVGQRSYMVRESMRALEERVRADGFQRAHRRALVRLGAIRELTKTRDGDLSAVLGSGARVPISRRRRAGFVGELKGVRG